MRSKKWVYLMLEVSAAVVFVAWAAYFVDAITDFYTADTNKWGTFGDFIGGTLGTLFALMGTLMMYWTFRSQRLLTHQSNRTQKAIAAQSVCQAELQRFNDLFFSLLHRYHDLARELNEIAHCECECTEINYFDRAMHDMYNEFTPNKDYGRSALMAKRRYMDFYLENSPMLAPLLRTLYRLMDLIDTAEIDSLEKLRYAKIVRAQLRESELFFLRYNCMTEYGENFITYINRYKLLKHLPMMSLLEFKYLRERTEASEQTNLSLPLNVISSRIWKRLYNITVGRAPRPDHVITHRLSSRYTIEIDMTSEQETTLTMQVDIHNKNNKTELKPLSRLSYNDMERLVWYILQEIYLYSNFHKFNPEQSELKFDHSCRITNGLVVVSAHASSNTPLRLCDPIWDPNYRQDN